MACPSRISCRSMRVAITGSSGLRGTALGARLQSRGHELLRVVRGPPEQASALWDPASGWFREGALEGVDTVVHLAGASIAGKRWTARRKQLLHASRIEGTRLLVDHIGGLSQRPRVLVSASRRRLLWGPWRRGALRGRCARERLSLRAVPGLGGGGAPCAGVRSARRAAAHRRLRALPQGWSAATHADAVPPRRRRQAGPRASVVLLDLAPGRLPRDRTPAQHGVRIGTGELGLAQSGQERRVHTGARPRPAPPRAAADAGIRAGACSSAAWRRRCWPASA